MIIVILGAIFIFLTLAIGGDRTSKSLATLGGNAIVLGLSIKALFSGVNPIIVTIVAALLVCLITLFYQNENNVKSRSALLSVIVVTIIMLGLIVAFVYQGHIQGMSGSSVSNIRADNGYPGNIGINMVLLEVIIILVTLIGAVIDTAVAVTSGIYEVYKHNSHMNRRELWASGMRIGSDILSSTVNTLFFIFIGEFLATFITFAKYYPFEMLINSKEFAQGIITIMISAASCVIIIPIAALSAAALFKKAKTNKKEGINNGC